MQRQLITTAILAGIMLALSCNSQAQEKVVVVPLFSATGDAIAGDVRSGKTFSNATHRGLTGTWVPDDPATGDATAADVLAGKTFSNATANGITGLRSPAPVAATGQTVGDPIASTAGSDGNLANGITVTTRFTDKSDGTVTDNLTGLVWLKDASCSVKVNWTTALTDTAALENGTCSLTDGSQAGDWRLPNLNELQSLLDMSENSPPLPSGHPFTGVEAGGGGDSYWTSTTVDRVTTSAWLVGFQDGIVLYADKTGTYFTWPVRDAD